MMGRLLKPGQVRRPAKHKQAFKAFGKKSAGSSNDSLLFFWPPGMLVVINIDVGIIQPETKDE
jgi:hypothetical protein